jgi:hypothetical protein
MPEVETPVKDAVTSKPRVLPFDEFCKQTVAAIVAGNLSRLQSFSPGHDGLGGVLEKAYESYMCAVESGWKRFGK